MSRPAPKGRGDRAFPPVADPAGGLLERAVAALETLAAAAVACSPAPALRPAGPVLLVPKGAILETTVSDHPLGKDALFPVVPGDYDGEVRWDAEDQAGGRVVASAGADPSGPGGSVGRVALAAGAVEGDTYTVTATADTRHGSGVVNSTHTWTMTVVARDAAPLQEAGDPRFVDPGAPA